MRHGDLFSGIGVFAKAAEDLGIKHRFSVEINPFCRGLIRQNFPNIEVIHDDVRSATKSILPRVDILTGGFPCQPFSVAGKRKGANDDRALWHEMFRIIQELKPTWIIAENVNGILTIDGGMVFQGVRSDLESAGYEVQTFNIPACALDASHERRRIWIVAHARSERDRPGDTGRQNPRNEKRDDSQEEQTGYDVEHGVSSTDKVFADSGSQRLEELNPVTIRAGMGFDSWRDVEKRNGGDPIQIVRELCRMDDGFAKGLHETHSGNSSVDRSGKEKNPRRKKSDKYEKERLEALGNAMYYPLCVQLLKAILHVERTK